MTADEFQQAADEAAARGVINGHDRPELRAVDLPRVVAGARLVDLVAIEHQVAQAAFLVRNEIREVGGVVPRAPREQRQVALDRVSGGREFGTGEVEQQRVAAERGTTVVLAEGWAGNPAVIAARDAWANDFAAADVIEAELLAPDVAPGRAQILTVLRLLRAIGRPLLIPAVTSAVGGGLLLVAQGAEATWSLFAARTAGPARLHLSASNADVQVELDLYSPQTATPALARRTDTDRELRLDALYESGHRRAWRRLKNAIAAGTAGTSGSDDLAAFAADVRAADAAVAQRATDDDTTKENK